MRTRRYHQKSRLGCDECKSRRVKCDEARPVCRACARSGALCHYQYFKNTSTPPRIVPKKAEMESSKDTSPESDHDNNSMQSGFDLLDLSLMNHYSLETSLQLFFGERQSRVWQRHIPALAASSIMLTHGVLAIAALHRARHEPDQRTLYRTRALQHHSAGLRLFQDTVAAATSGIPETADTLLAFALLLGIWVYAFPGAAAEQLPLDELLDLLEVVRGTKKIFMLYKDAIAGKPLSTLHGPPIAVRDPLSDNLASSAREALHVLRSRLTLASDRTGVDYLEMLLNRLTAGRDYVRLTAGWIAISTDDFWMRLRDHDPNAVLVFAHIAILMRCAEDEMWWMAGWSERVLQACDQALSPADKQAIDWEKSIKRIRREGDELAQYVGAGNLYAQIGSGANTL